MAEIHIIPSAGCSPYEFGAALASFGDELLVGAPSSSYGYRRAEGKDVPLPVACLFRRVGDAWELQEILSAHDPAPADGFGRSVALTGRFATVGAPGYSDITDGVVRDFARGADDRLELAATYDSPDTPIAGAHTGAPGEGLAQLGQALASSEGELVIGAPLEERGPAVYIFDRASRSRPPVVLRGAEGFGASIALAGELLAVGPGAFTPSGEPGTVRVFRRRAPDAWSELFRIDGQSAGELFGAAVALDGDRLAITAPGRGDLRGPPGSGRVELIAIEGDRWRALATIHDAHGFGSAIAWDGDRLAVGDAGFATASGPRQTGRVGLYRVDDDGHATHEEWLALPSARAFARLGTAVVLGPDYVAAGAPGLTGKDDGQGSVLVKPFSSRH